MAQHKFVINKLASKKYNDGTQITKFQLYKRNKRWITPEELKAMLEHLQKQNPSLDVAVRGNAHSLKDIEDFELRALGPTMWRQIKSRGKDDIKYSEIDDYFENKVKEPEKFMRYYQLELTIIKKI